MDIKQQTPPSSTPANVTVKIGNQVVTHPVQCYIYR